MLKDIIIKNRDFIFLTLGIFLIILATILLLYQRIALQKEKVFSTVAFMKDNSEEKSDNNIVTDSQVDINTGYIDETENDDGNNDVLIPKEDIAESKSEKKIKEYIGYLEIPKISLKYGFVAKNSYYNNVNRNIQILNISDFPNVEGGNFIIAGHSGSSEVSYFGLLFKLKVGDKAIVTYKGETYNYKIASIYKEKKDGALNIKRDVTKTTLTLITCSYKDRVNQTVYIAELISSSGGES